MQIPPIHQQIMPYLIVENAKNLIEFLTEVFDANLSLKKMRDADLIMHAEMVIGSHTIMLADATEDWKAQNAGLFIYVENADQVYQKALERGSTSLMPPSDEDYGRSCGVVDPTGNVWWITSVN